MNTICDHDAALPHVVVVAHRDGSRSADLGTDLVIIPANNMHRPAGPVLLAVRAGFSDEHRAIEAAFAAAAYRHAPLIAVHCWQEPGALGLPSLNWSPIDWASNREIECEQLSERLAGFRERYPDVAVHRVVRSAPTGSALLPLAREAQLVVVGGFDHIDRHTLSHDTVVRALVRGGQAPLLITARAAQPDTSAAHRAYAGAMWVCRHVLECQEIV